jgi:hypothetical protein
LQLATVLKVKIESPSEKRYSHVTGGYIRLEGELGRVNFNALKNADWRGDDSGAYTYECFLDVHPKIFNEEQMESCPNRPSLYCLPIATGGRAHRQVYCLLMEQVQEATTNFVRVGLLKA